MMEKMPQEKMVVLQRPDSGDIHFIIDSYIKDALKIMEMMRNHQLLTDVILDVGTELFHAHKIVLAAASPYFKAMFTGGLKESEMQRIKLQGISKTALGQLLHFIYTGEIRVSENTVCQLLPAATMFQVSPVIDACCCFLERQLEPSNAIGIANFAELHGCKELYQKASQFIERHFLQICNEEEFLQLSGIQLVSLIRKDELNVHGEGDVYNAVLKWVKYDEENRFSKMESILSAVRCQYLTPSFLKDQMAHCDVLKKLPSCREYLAQIFKDLTLHKKPGVRERKPRAQRIIFVAGGYFRHSLDTLEGLNIDDKTWVSFAKLTVPRSGLGAAFLKGMFYAVGGRNTSPNHSYDSDWVDRYNPQSDSWRPCAPLATPRNRVGVAVLDELLYAAGGSAGEVNLSSVERYDPDIERWQPVKSMLTERIGLGLVVVNRLLYAIGGYNGVSRLNSCECYHPENDEWTFIAPMKVKKSGAGVAALNQYIYAVGGYDGTHQLTCVERYNTERDEWEFVAPLSTARSALSVSVIDNKIYAIGGYDGSSFLSVVEIYDPVGDKWETSVPMNTGRSGHASAVIYHHCAKDNPCHFHSKF